MIALIDYGVGNLFSLSRSFAAIGEEAVITHDEKTISDASKIILPGVGAYADAAEKLLLTGMGELLIREARKGKPILGICLGMQLLFTRSLEYGEHKGLGLIEGDVVPIDTLIPQGLKVPHIGWNGLIFRRDCPLFTRIKNGECVYFVHSYAAVNCDNAVAAETEYGAMLTAVVQRDNVFGCQFHPEKSGKTGLNILKSFCEVRA